MEKLRDRAIQLGAEDFDYSKAAGKRYYVVYQGRKINFGSAQGRAYIDHGDSDKRDLWYKRHSKIKNKHGDYVINLKTSPDWWAARILWPK
jgi:hypothetical protein